MDMSMDTLDIHLWADLARRLSRVLARMAEGEFLVICVKRSNRFVQFAAQGAHGLRAEATSNAYLKGSERIDLDDIEKLAALGWNPPTGGPAQSTPGNDPSGSPNYFRGFAADSNPAQIAELAIRTLREVFDAPSPIFLEYEAFDEDGNQTTHSELGLKRAIRDPQVSMAKLADSLLDTVREHANLPGLDFDDDGWIGLTYGQTGFHILLRNSPAMIEFNAILVQGVPNSLETLAFINNLNHRYGAIRFTLRRDAILATREIPAIPFIAEHVVQTMNQFGMTTDGLAEFLQSLREHGGAIGDLTDSHKH